MSALRTCLNQKRTTARIDLNDLQRGSGRALGFGILDLGRFGILDFGRFGILILERIWNFDLGEVGILDLESGILDF